MDTQITIRELVARLIQCGNRHGFDKVIYFNGEEVDTEYFDIDHNDDHIDMYIV
jgi:hypothetical protein